MSKNQDKAQDKFDPTAASSNSSAAPLPVADPIAPATPAIAQPAPSALQGNGFAPTAQTIEGVSDHQAAIAAQPAPNQQTHVPSTYDASVGASGAAPYPIAAPGAQALPRVEVPTDPDLTRDFSLPTVPFETFRDLSRAPRDQIAGFARWVGSRHGANRYTINEWQDMLDGFLKQEVK